MHVIQTCMAVGDHGMRGQNALHIGAQMPRRAVLIRPRVALNEWLR